MKNKTFDEATKTYDEAWKTLRERQASWEAHVKENKALYEA